MGSEGPTPAVTVHITGFKKFHGVAENPTEKIVSNLQEYMNKRGLPKGLVLGSVLGGQQRSNRFAMGASNCYHVIGLHHLHNAACPIDYEGVIRQSRPLLKLPYDPLNLHKINLSCSLLLEDQRLEPFMDGESPKTNLR
ncbi:hypothetical protein Sango_0684900 [Sesamum angolense]|uniref:Uncharacterized protein n=1 Tax=Sesamum angolense TaxID=2727404 RepID=A0AAE1X8N7_9LAMI|nr:hypothetical protein Sango_0684900 [Sesamum angolense]